MNAHKGPIAGVAITPEGAVLSAAYDRDAILWSSGERCTPLARFDVSAKNVNCAAASMCGAWLATGASDGHVALINRATGDVLKLDHPGDVEAVAFSADGSRVASGGTDGMVRVFATCDGVLLGVLPHGRTVGCVRYLSSGALLSVCNDGVLRFWDGDLSLGWSIQLSTLPLKSLAVIDDVAFIGGHDATIRLVNLADRSTRVVFTLATTPKALASDGTRLVLAAYDDTLRVAELAGWAGGELPFVTISRSSRLWSHGVDTRGDLIAAGSFDGAPLLWRRSGQTWIALSSPEVEVPCISAAADTGELLVTGGDSGVLQAGGDRIAVLNEAITSVKTAGRALVVSTWSGNVHILERGGRRAYAVSECPVVCSDVHGGSYFAGLYTGGVYCLALADGAPLWHCAEATGAIKSVHIHDDLLAAVGRYDPLRVIDARSGAVLARLPLETSVSDAVRFSPDGQMLACAAGDGEVWFVRVRRSPGVSLQLVGRSPGHKRPIKAITWAERGVVYAGDYAGCVVRHASGEPSRVVATIPCLLGISALIVRGDDLLVTTFDGTVSTLALRMAA